MDLWGSLFGRRNAVGGLAPRVLTTYELTDPGLAEWMRSGSGVSTAAGVAVSPESSLRVSTAYRCVNLISDHISTLPLEMKRRVDDRTREDVYDHPVAKLLRRPNSWQTPMEFRKLLQTSVLLRGNGYAFIVRSMGKIVALLPLTGQMCVRQNSDSSLEYDYISRLGVSKTLKQEDVFHLRGLSLDGFTGLSVIGHARETLGLSLVTERHANRAFKNRASVGGILSTENILNETEVERLKSRLEEFRSPDSDDSYKDLVLENKMKYDRIGMTFADAQFLQQREMAQHEIATFFGVPPHRVGLTSKQTSFGTGIVEQNISFVQDSLTSWATMWEQTILRDLLANENPRLYVKHNFKALMRGDNAARASYYQTMFNTGSMSPNDIRAAEDENPREGGDEYFVGIKGGNASGGESPQPADPNAPAE